MKVKRFSEVFEMDRFGDYVFVDDKGSKFYAYPDTGNVYRQGLQGFQEPIGRFDEKTGEIAWH